MKPADEICIGSTTSDRVAFTVDDQTVAILDVASARIALDRLAAAIERCRPELRGTFPVVLYFGTLADADEFIEVVRAAKPGLVARNL